MPPPLRYRDVALMLGVSVRTLGKLVAERRIKAHRLSARCVRFWLVDVEKFKASTATKNF